MQADDIPDDKEMKIGKSVTEVAGKVLKVKNRYVCWNSFKSEYYLGKKSHLEIFAWNPFKEKDKMFEKARKAFPNATELLIGD